MTISDAEFMNMIRPKPDQKVVLAVTLHSGEVWQDGKPIPSNNKTRIIRMFERDDGAVVVYYSHEPGTPEDKAQVAFDVTLGSMVVKSITRMSKFDVWKADLVAMVRDEEGELVCPKCDAVVEDETLTVCQKCGASLEEDEPVRAEPPIPPPPQHVANGQT